MFTPKLSALAAAALFAAYSPSMPASTTVAPYGHLPDGTAIEQYTLTNAHGLVCKVITYGATLTNVETPDRDGHLADIVLGFDNLAGYLGTDPYFGATIGRVANRIARGHFTLDGKTYSLPVNDGPNTLHGGLKGFDKVVWTAKAMAKGTGVELRYTSPDGQEGFPGTLRVRVRYVLTDDNALHIEYWARTDADTPINLTNHTYWNLSGHGSILNDLLTLHASRYTPVDSTLIPTGELVPVAGGPMDFRTPKRIGQDLGKLTNQPQGYDFNWVLDHPGLGSIAAELYDPASGRVLDVETDQPGIQFYTGNFLDGTITGKGGVKYQQHTAVCLETQHFPDSVNQPSFPSTILHRGDTYRTTTLYRFGVR